MITRLTVRNYRGVDVPAVLGLVLAGFGAASAVVVAAADHVPAAGWVACLGGLLVAAAGLVDDLLPAGPRGLRGHVRGLAAGRVSTGVVKLVVIVASAIVTVAAGSRGEGVTRLAGVILIAAASNLWNGLDVRPGRAIKFALPVLPAVLLMPWTDAPFVPGVWLGALLVLPWDAGERAMLGDCGSNLLGFAMGLALYGALTPALIWVAAVVAVALNVLADTVTLTRVIDAAAPLRWFDRLGTSAAHGED